MLRMPTWVAGAYSSAAAHRAGVVVPGPHVAVAQIGVGVDLQHAQAGILRRGRRHQRRRDRVLPAKRHQELVALEDLGGHPLESRPSAATARRTGSSISGSVKIPTAWTSIPSSSSHNSMCDDACEDLARAVAGAADVRGRAIDAARAG